MTRALTIGLSFAAGASLSFLITADLYGRVITHETLGGIACRVYGYEAYRTGDWLEDREYFCAPALGYKIMEDDLWAQIIDDLRSMHNLPR